MTSLEDRIMLLLLAGGGGTEAEISTALSSAPADVGQALVSLLVRGLVEIRDASDGAGAVPTPRSRFAVARPDGAEGLNIGRLRALMDQSSFGDRRPRRTRGKIDAATVAGVVAAANDADSDPSFARLAYALALLADGNGDAEEGALLTLIGLLSDPAAASRHPQVRDVLLAMLREGKDRLHHQATHDPLTGLGNRSLFVQRLAAAFENKAAPEHRLGVCYIDLDGFKAVNETFGHHFGDQLLAAIGQNLVLGIGEHLIARLDSDKFVILAEGTDGSEELLRVAELALHAISTPATANGHTLAVSASIGVVEGPACDTTPSEVLHAAEIAMRWAKADGGGRWTLYDPARHDHELARYQLVSAMPAALERDEFFLDYQPVVALADGTLLGAEALARWRHPTLGVLTPDSFLAVAEETGMIGRLSAWVLDEACRQARQWADLHPQAPYVCVNLAVRQVRDPNLTAQITAVLERHELHPDRLQLEITESALMSATDTSLQPLHSLADLGVRIAIDDFGTGYSNLSYLRSLPIRELKVAGSLVSGIGKPAGTIDDRILATLVSLAHALGITVTAIGVETAEQADRLRTIGCDSAQGWHLGLPGPPHRINSSSPHSVGS